MIAQPAVSPRTRRPFFGFDREQAAYQLHRPRLLDQAEGQFFVFVGDEMLGPFLTRPEAEAAGYSQFGLGPLFIKQVLAEERATEVSRFVIS